MLDRRDFLLSALSTALLPSDGLARAAVQLDEVFERILDAELKRDPERATELGVDNGARAALKGRLRDESLEGFAARVTAAESGLRLLKSVNRDGLTATERINYDSVLYEREAQLALLRFRFGSLGYHPSPYVISQRSGAYQSVPEFLDTQHQIAGVGDAEAYLSRVSAFAVQLDQETQRLRHDSAAGVRPPDFILDLALGQMAALNKPAGQTVIVTSIARRARSLGLSASFGEKAERLFDQRVRPALHRQIAAVQAIRTSATHEAGVGRFAAGPAFYAAALKSNTTTSLSPAEVHQLGLDQAAEIGGRLDAVLELRGLTQGTIAKRIQALYADPDSFFPNTDAGKAEAIRYCNGRLDAIRPRLTRVFKSLPPYRFEVRRVPAQLEAGASAASSESPSLDGSRPGIVYINLHNSAEWPKWSLATTIFHEGLPGHQLQGGLALSQRDLPLIRRGNGFSGYAEGWALYAEQLADEMGMYADDPASRIGYLRFQLFRAGRCVVDTGIHHLGWSRERAIRYLTELDGETAGFATREVERYCVEPGQACSYKLGHTVWTAQRAKAQKALGSRYDIRSFHEAGLACGRVPLEVLERVIEEWITRSSLIVSG
ncbi:MAG: DUF885 family protein [Proteobacteria bacterium]|nr:DUF885 family protein [Pseudomonadota bacterium]